MIWDGIRAVDYLLTREEVDSARIGITGRSGGGTQSSQIAALDERIYAAAPKVILQITPDCFNLPDLRMLNRICIMQWNEEWTMLIY